LRKTYAAVLLSALLASVTAVGAQTQPATSVPPAITVPATGETQELVLRDGSRAYGQVDRVEGGVVRFRTVAGATIEVPLSEVVSVGIVEGRFVNGEFRRADANPTRLFFAPTGRSLRRRQAYLGVYEILMPFLQYGLTDRISVGAGTPLIFGGGGARPFWVTPKVQVLSTRNIDAAIGVMHFLNVGDNGSFGIAYGVLTRGNADSAVTGGVGWAYARYDDNEGTAIGMIGGEHRVRRGLKVITENYVWSGGGIVTGGVRFLGERFSTDLGLVVPMTDGEFIGFPILNFVWNITRK